MNTKYKLDSNLKFIGNFWLPQKEKQRIHGLLYFNQIDGGLLKLDESLKDQHDPKYFSFLNYDIILGKTNKHELITLFKCKEKRISVGNIPETEIKVKVIFIGKHFKTPGEINFHHVNVKYKYFENWINLSGFDIKLNFKNKNYLNCIETTYELPNEIKYKINDQTTLIISFSFNGPKIFSEFQKEIEIKQSIFLKIYLKQKKSFINYKEYIYSIRNFLTLSLSYNSFPNNIIGKLENKNKTDDQKKKYQNIHILYKVFGFSKIQKKISKTDMLFTFKDVKTDFKEYLNNWFEIINEIKPVFNLYFSMIYNDNIFLEQLFLSSVKALEIYHRKIYGGKYLTGKKYKKLYNKLINSIPKSTQKSLKDKLKTSLKYGNEYSLRKRLKIIYNEHKSIINNFVINKKYFIAKVVDTRNYLTHYDKKLENKIAKGNNLAIITRKIKLILEICFLKEIGLEENKIKNILMEKYNFLINKKN